MIMLTSFYFLMLVESLKNLDKARSEVIAAIHGFEKGGGGMKQFGVAESAFEDASKRFKNEIIAEGQRYSDIDLVSEARRLIKRTLRLH